MNRLAAVLALAVLLAAGAAGWRWWNGPERQVRRMLSDVAAMLSDEREDRGLADVAAAAALGRHLAADVLVDPGRPFEPVAGRDAAMASVGALRAAARGLRVAFSDVRVGVAPDGLTATVHATATATTRDRSGAAETEAREVLLTTTLEGGRWVISRASAIPVLERVD